MNGRTTAERDVKWDVDYYEDAARTEMEAADSFAPSSGVDVARAQVWATLALAAATDETRRSVDRASKRPGK